MRVLIISTYDTEGAAIAATRLMHALQSAVTTFPWRYATGWQRPIGLPGRKPMGNRFRFYGERGIIYLHNRLSRRYLFDVSIANSGVSVTDLPEFGRPTRSTCTDKPGDAVTGRDRSNRGIRQKGGLTMHDMWPFTGICHTRRLHPLRDFMRQLPYLVAGSPNDLSHKLFRRNSGPTRKEESPSWRSRWLRELAEKSPHPGT